MSSYVYAAVISKKTHEIIELGSWSRNSAMWQLADECSVGKQWDLMSNVVDRMLEVATTELEEYKALRAKDAQRIEILKTMTGDWEARYEEILAIMSNSREGDEEIEAFEHAKHILQYWNKLTEEQEWYESARDWVYVIAIEPSFKVRRKNMTFAANEVLGLPEDPVDETDEEEDDWVV